MISRLLDASILARRISETPEIRRVEVDLEDFINDTGNVVLMDGEDIAVFERDSLGSLKGHYLFKSGGRKAIEVGERMIQKVFADYPVYVIVGLTPLTNKPALWMNRKLGFNPGPVVETEYGPEQYFFRFSGRS